MTEAVRNIVRELNLAPHPEGGFYREVYRSPLTFPLARGSRAVCTAIYFLLPAGAFSAVHRVRSDEVWTWCGGDSLDLHTLDDAGNHAMATLGAARPLAVVPAGLLQAAVARGEYALVTATVAPGFDFADFQMPSRSELVAVFPQHAEWLLGVTR